MSLQSTVTPAKIGTKSVRATIPEGIVAFLGIESGNKIDWKMEVTGNGERFVIVKKLDDYEKSRAIAAKYKRKK